MGVELARSLRAASLSAAVPLIRENTLEQRIKALFDDRRSHRLLGSRPARGLFVGAVVLMTGLGAVHTGTLEHEPHGIAPPPAPAVTIEQAQDEQKTITPTAVTPALEKSPVAKPEESLPRTYTHPITLSAA